MGRSAGATSPDEKRETTMDDRVSVEHATSQKDGENAVNIVVAMLARGHEPAEIAAAAAMAVALFNVVASPDDDAVVEANTKNTADFIRNVQADMWPKREELRAYIEQRVARVTPMAEVFKNIMAQRRAGGGDTRPKETEPQHEQFKA